MRNTADRARWWTVSERVLVNLLLAVLVIGCGWWLGMYATTLMMGVPRSPNEFTGLKDFVILVAPSIVVGTVVQQGALLAVGDRLPIPARRLAAVLSCCLIPGVWLALSHGDLGLWGTWLGLSILTIVLIVYGLLMRL